MNGRRAMPFRRFSYSCQFGDTLIIVLLFTLTFGVLLPVICRDWVYSSFYDKSICEEELVKRVFDLNGRRLDKAREYFASTSTKFRYQSKNIDIAIAIIGATRQKDNYSPGYLTQTAAEFHKQLVEDQYFPGKYAFICNVDPVPGQANEINHLRKYFDSIDRFGGKFIEERFSKDKFNKSKDDYAFCMKVANTFNPKYVLVLEDDVIIHDNFFRTLNHVLKTKLLRLEEKHFQHGKNNWSYIKLFYPEKWSGFGRQWSHHMERAGIFLCGGVLFSLARLTLTAWTHGTRRAYQLHVRSWATRKWFLAGALYCLALCQFVGRPYLMPLLSPTPSLHRLLPAPECCTPAVLYRADVVPEMVGHLYATPATERAAHDLVMDRWADSRGLARYLVSPNLVTHIGYISTARQWSKKAAQFIY